jgi:NADPH-dependent curcumin reductase CurA
MSKTNPQWRLAARPEGDIKDSDFEWSEPPVGDVGDGEMLVRNVYLSLDPTNRVWMRDAEGYMPAVALGDVMRGFALAVVEESNNDRFEVGDVVQGLFGWQTYAISNGKGVVKIPPGPYPLVAVMGALGHIGATAYFGIRDIGKVVKGDTVVVSAAAGAVGSLAVQIARFDGGRVIGIAGTDERCRYLTEELGCAGAINRKTENIGKALDKHCPDGIDVYFDNAGGEILEAVLNRINIGARIPLCGMISLYNVTAPPPGPRNLSNLITKRARMEGFLVMDYADRFMESAMAIIGWIGQDKLKYRVDVVDGLDNAPGALRKLFEGTNAGKLLVKVSDEPDWP